MAWVLEGGGFGLFEWPGVFSDLGSGIADCGLIFALVEGGAAVGWIDPGFQAGFEDSGFSIFAGRRERRLVRNSARSSRMSLHSTMRSAISERPFGLRVRWWSRCDWMMGMIWAGVGFWPGVRMKRRLQRAFKYGVSRVASRDWSSARVLGKGMSQVSMNL